MLRAPADFSPPSRTYTTREVAEMTQVKVRNLQYWDEQRVVSPQQAGHRRMYLPEEVVEIAVIAELRKKGFSLREIRKLLRLLKRELSERLAMPASSDSNLYLLTDGRSIHLEHEPDRIISILAKTRRPMSLVCVSGQSSRRPNRAA
ncbi:MAG: MerR family transcriptional regulator [Bryobacteraceae bacterium]